MLHKINPTTTKTWTLLQEHYNHQMQHQQMKALFEQDEHRFKNFSLQFQDIFFDYSKNIINQNTLNLLIQFAEECKLQDAITAQFNGEKINETEHRAVLHTALRNKSNQPIIVDGEDISININKVLQQMKSFCCAIHNGDWKGYSGKKIKYIINVDRNIFSIYNNGLITFIS